MIIIIAHSHIIVIRHAVLITLSSQAVSTAVFMSLKSHYQHFLK